MLNQKNIEAIYIKYIINQEDNYNLLLKDIEPDFFLNPVLKNLYQKLKKGEEASIALLKIGLSDKQKEYFSNKKLISTDPMKLKKYLVNVYKERYLKETAILINKSSPEKKEQLIKEVNEKLKKLEIYEVRPNDAKNCISDYEKFLKNAREAKLQGQIGIPTGIKELDEKIMGLKNIEYILLAARPSMGKTSLATKFFLQSIYDNKQEGVPVFFSLEMEKEQLMGRMVAQASKSLHLKHTIFGDENNNGEIKDILNSLKQKQFYIEDYKEASLPNGITPDLIDSTLESIRNKEGKISLIIIDYIQLIEHMNKMLQGANKLREISGAIKSLARKYGCPVVVLSQLNRELEKRNDKRPKMSDLKESGALEENADIIMFVYRAAVYLEKELKERLAETPDAPDLVKQLELLRDREITEAEIIIDKNRNGPTGIANTYFKKASTNFDDIEQNNDTDIEDIFKNSELYE